MKNKAEQQNKIVEACPESSETVFIEQELRPGKELDEAEAINIFSQAIWKLFEDNRRIFANSLGTDELDAVLADARVLAVEVKKEKIYRLDELVGVRDPIKMRAYLTVVNRNILPKEAYAVVEPGTVRAHLTSVKEKKPVLFIETREGTSSVYLAHSSAVKRLNSWEWGRRDVLKRMSEELLTSADVNNEIYMRYIKGEVGPIVSERIESIFIDSLREFQKGLAAALYNHKTAVEAYPKTPVFIRSEFPLPAVIYKKRIPCDGRRVALKETESELKASDLFSKEDVLLSEELSKTVLQKIKWLMV